MKVCLKCGLQKDIEQFYAAPRMRDGLSSECKGCKKARAAIWEAENVERRNARRRAWKEHNSEKYLAAQRAWGLANRVRLAARARERYAVHPEAKLARGRAWYAAHAHDSAERGRAWRKENKDRANAAVAERKARKIQASPAWANEFFISEIYDLAALRTKHTGIDWHVDHIVPLKSPYVCGLHVENNLQVIPSLDNYKKGNRHWPDMPIAAPMAS